MVHSVPRQVCASGPDVLEVVFDVVDEVQGQGRDGEGFAVAAVTRALPAVADFTQDRRGPRRLLRDVVRDHRGVGLEVRGGGVVVILRPE